MWRAYSEKKQLAVVFSIHSSFVCVFFFISCCVCVRSCNFVFVIFFFFLCLAGLVPFHLVLSTFQTLKFINIIAALLACNFCVSLVYVFIYGSRKSVWEPLSFAWNALPSRRVTEVAREIIKRVGVEDSRWCKHSHGTRRHNIIVLLCAWKKLEAASLHPRFWCGFCCAECDKDRSTKQYVDCCCRFKPNSFIKMARTLTTAHQIAFEWT